MKHRVKIVMGSAKSAALDPIRNIRLCFHKEIARDTDNPFIGTAPGRRRQFCFGGIRDVYADHGEIAVCQFPDVGTIVERNRLSAVCVRVGADSAEKHRVGIHCMRTIGQTPE